MCPLWDGISRVKSEGNMMRKRFLSAILALIFSLSLVACGNGEMSDSAAASNDTPPVEDAVLSDEGESAQPEDVGESEDMPKVEESVEEDISLPESESNEVADVEVPPVEEKTEEQDIPVTEAVEEKKPAETESVPIVVHQHSYTASIVPGTCTSKGYTTYTCACGHSYTSDYTGGGGHSYKEVYENVPVYETVVVTRCGHCHAALDDVGGVAHIEQEALAGNGSRSYQSAEQVLVGYENQLVGYACSVCGAER